jgi:hypothetical protein
MYGTVNLQQFISQPTEKRETCASLWPKLKVIPWEETKSMNVKKSATTGISATLA